MTQPALKVAPLAKAKMTLANVRKGRMQAPIRVFIYGVPKVGKSTFAAGAPSPIFLGADAGTEQLDVHRLPQPETWEEAIEAIRLIAKEPNDYQTLVVDPLNWLEPLLWAYLCRTNNWKDIEAPGFGKGYNAAVDQWRTFAAELERVWTAGKNIVLVAHSSVSSFKNPEGADFDRYTPAMHKAAWPVFTGWVDAVLFARVETFSKAEGKAKAKGFSTGARVVHTEWHATWEGGNRWALPQTLPLGWDEVMGAIADAEKQGDALRAQIGEMAAQVGPDAIGKANELVRKAGSRLDTLRGIVNALAIKLQEMGK